MASEKWKMVAVPKGVWNVVKEVTDDKSYWTSPTEFVRDAIKDKLRSHGKGLNSNGLLRVS